MLGCGNQQREPCMVLIRDQYRTLTSELMLSWMCVRWVGWKSQTLFVLWLLPHRPVTCLSLVKSFTVTCLSPVKVLHGTFTGLRHRAPNSPQTWSRKEHAYPLRSVRNRTISTPSDELEDTVSEGWKDLPQLQSTVAYSRQWRQLVVFQKSILALISRSRQTGVQCWWPQIWSEVLDEGSVWNLSLTR